MEGDYIEARRVVAIILTQMEIKLMLIGQNVIVNKFMFTMYQAPHSWGFLFVG